MGSKGGICSLSVSSAAVWQFQFGYLWLVEIRNGKCYLLEDFWFFFPSVSCINWVLLYMTAVICTGEENTRRTTVLEKLRNTGRKPQFFQLDSFYHVYQTSLCVPLCLKSLTPGEQNKRYRKSSPLAVISYFLCCWLDFCSNKNIYFCGSTGTPWFCSEGSILCLILASCHGNNYDVMNSVQWLHCSVFYLYSQVFFRSF